MLPGMTYEVNAHLIGPRSLTKCPKTCIRGSFSLDSVICFQVFAGNDWLFKPRRMSGRSRAKCIEPVALGHLWILASMSMLFKTYVPMGPPSFVSEMGGTRQGIRLSSKTRNFTKLWVTISRNHPIQAFVM